MLGAVIRNVSLLLALTASAAAALGWGRAPRTVVRTAPSVRIDEIRPLRTSDEGVRDLITHTFAVRVRIAGWALLPFRPGTTAADNRRGAGHWRLYLDGQALGDNLGAGRRTYVYMSPGAHWLAAELSNADSTSLRPAVWSEPVTVHVPRYPRR
jgi:hypothetical protein